MRKVSVNACYDATSLSCYLRAVFTIGMALAQATGFRLPVDTDRWLQSHVQMSVADIVEKRSC